MDINTRIKSAVEGIKRNKKIAIIVPPFLSVRFDDTPNVSLGILTIATILKNMNYEYEFSLPNDDDNLDIMKNGTSIICYSGDISSFRYIKSHISNISHHVDKPLIIVGGALPTSLPDEWMGIPGVDIVFLGEADVSLRELLNNNSIESIHGVAYHNDGLVQYQRSRLPNSDELVYPDYEILHTELPRKSNIQIQVGRGCNYACKICGYRTGYVRTNMNEFEYCYKEILEEGRENITFVDNDLFSSSIDDVLKILSRHGSNARWSCSIKSDVDLCERYLERMVDLGCIKISVDMQHVSGCIHDVNNLFAKRYVHKDANYYIKLIRLIRSYGIEPTVAFHVGLLGETDDTIVEAKRFFEATEVGVYDIRPFVYPGSKYFERAFEKGKRSGIFSSKGDYMEKLDNYIKNTNSDDAEVSGVLDVFNLSEVKTYKLMDAIDYLNNLSVYHV